MIRLPITPEAGAAASATLREEEKIRQFALLCTQYMESYRNLNLNLLRDFYEVLWPRLNNREILGVWIGQQYQGGMNTNIAIEFERRRTHLARAVYLICDGVAGRMFSYLDFDESVTLYVYYKACVEVFEGIHEAFVTDDGYVKKLVEKPQRGVQGNTFHQFQNLPTGIRMMIWRLAIRDRNRVVFTKGLRKITYAPCPRIFLVCKDSYACAKLIYKKVRGGDLIQGKVVPVEDRAAGPIVSFEYDIFMADGWDRWRTTQNTGAEQTVRYRRYYLDLPLRPIETRIEAFRISRVAFRRAEAESRKFEMVFYKNARKCYTLVDEMTDERDEWAWAWTEGIEEVWVLDYTPSLCNGRVRRHLNRMFPPLPKSDCVCSLCQTVLYMGQENVWYTKPDPLDIEEHERLFNQIAMDRNWPDGVRQPDLAHHPVPIDYKWP